MALPRRLDHSLGQLLLVLLAACASSRREPAPRNAASTPAPAPTTLAASTGIPERCALIQTDDDIPSGSATAGALYVTDAKLGKELLTRDVVATARGFLDAGFACVRVIDSHDGAIDPEPLRAIGVTVLTPANQERWTWPFFGDAAQHAAVAALVGFHSRGDQPTGFRPHTINDSVRAITMNGAPIGEVAHQILGLGAFGVPVGLVSGDMNATAEGAALVPSIEQVTVRWRDTEGKVQFLSSDEAAQELRRAARRAATAKLTPYRPAMPVEIGIRLHSRHATADLWRSMPGAFGETRAERRWDDRLLGGFEFEPGLRVEDGEARWSAPNALAAYVSIAFSASYLRGPSNFEIVTRGFDAYKKERWDEAIAAYEEALTANPYDVATRCRMAAVYQKLGKMTEARKCFRAGARDDSEIGDDVMKSWCWFGLAETEEAMKNGPAAREAAEKTLALPDFAGRHEKARKILTAVQTSPR